MLLNTLPEQIGLEQTITIVDVGANGCDGEPPYQILINNKIASLTGFEPQVDALELLLKNKPDNVTYLPYALGDGNEHTLNVYKYSGLASILEADESTFALSMNYRESRMWEKVNKIPLKTYRLDDIKDIEDIDLLKMDIQGAELLVLKNATEKLKKTLVIQIEVTFLPLYKEQPTFGYLDNELRKNGFLPHCIASRKDMLLAPVTSWNSLEVTQLLEMDIVYIKDFRRMDDFSIEQLRKIAIIMHYCYKSYNMALRCIKAIDEMQGTSLVDGYLKIIESENKG